MIKVPEVVRPGVSDDCADHLEHGRVVLFDKAPVELPSPADQEFLRTEAPRFISEKNISYYPQADKVSGLKGDRAVIDRATSILKLHHARVEAFLKKTMPGFLSNALPGTTSFRPMEEKGRNLSRHASNELVHVDAGAYGATHGDRIFRFFTNINPTEPRVWRVKGTFPDLFAHYRTQAGLPDRLTLEESGLDRFYSGFVRTMTRVFPMARSVDSSPYDRAMRRFHNFLKDSDEFQAGTEGERIVEFGPWNSWMVLTDMVGHACISGQHMLSNTYVLPLANCRHRPLAPYECLKASPARSEAAAVR